MRESGYYAPGTEFRSDAPWNQVDPTEVEFECCVSYTLERNSSLMTDEVYCDDGDWEVCEDADLWKAYEWDRKDIPALLAELVKYIDKELETTVDLKRKLELTDMRESATGWQVVDQDIEIT